MKFFFIISILMGGMIYGIEDEVINSPAKTKKEKKVKDKKHAEDKSKAPKEPKPIPEKNDVNSTKLKKEKEL